MNHGAELFISEDAIIRAVLILVYVPVCAIVYWRLIPRLSLTYKVLASGFLAAQVLAVGAALAYWPKSEFEVWLWNLEQEWNIPSTLTSTQLAVVGGIALVTALLANTRPARERLYLVSIGLIFPYLALDEYFKLHEHGQLPIPYNALGAITVLATIAVALRSPRQKLLWHAGLLAAIGIGVLGGIIIDGMPPLCDRFVFLPLDGCLQLSFWEESLELLGIWLAMVAMLGHLSDAVPKPKPILRSLLFFLPALWIFLLLLGPLVLHLEFRLLAQRADVQFESGVTLRGYRIDNKDKASNLSLYLSARPRDYIGRGIKMGYSVHLVDQENGSSLASRNEIARIPQDLWLFGPGHAPLFRISLGLSMTPQTPTNRAYWIVLTIWRQKGDEHVFQEVIASDRQLLGDRQVVLGEMVAPGDAIAAAAPPVAVFSNGFSLEAADVPERARAGEILSIAFTWRSEAAGQEDYIQFLHFARADDGDLWNHDQHPLGRRLPTRLWYSGLADSETWRVTLPTELEPGQYNIFTGLYRARDGERVPVNDAQDSPYVDARVPLGATQVER